MTYDDNFVYKSYARLPRGRIDLVGPCFICGSTEDIEIYYVHTLRKHGGTIKQDFLFRVIPKINLKQTFLCKICNQKVHLGKYDRLMLR